MKNFLSGFSGQLLSRAELKAIKGGVDDGGGSPPNCGKCDKTVNQITSKVECSWVAEYARCSCVSGNDGATCA